jgi:hypothetical protein
MEYQQQPTVPVIKIQPVPDYLEIKVHKEFLTWKKIYWLAALGFSALCAVAAYQIYTTHVFLISH